MHSDCSLLNSARSAPCLGPVQYCRAMSMQPPVRRGSDGRALPTRWMIYQLASSQKWIGEVDAKLMAVRRARSHSGLDLRCQAGWRVKAAPLA
jgi:hypothetical protein